MTDQIIVNVLTLNGTVLGVYAEHEDAEQTRIHRIHPTKQHDAKVYQCVVKPKGVVGF